MAKNIQVKTAEGRVAYDAPRGGKPIPSDRFVTVRESSYIRRLIDFHGDLIEEGGKSKKHTKTEAKDPTKTEPAPAAKPLPPTA